jgi:hypothetical protein
MHTPAAAAEKGALATGASLSEKDQGQSSTEKTSCFDTTRVGLIEMEREKSDSVGLSIIDYRVVPTAFSFSEARRAAGSPRTREIRHVSVDKCKPRYLQLLSTDPPTKTFLQPANGCTFVEEQIPSLEMVAWIHGPGSEPPSPSLFD